MSGAVRLCGSCGCPDLAGLLDLGLQPLPQATPGKTDERRYPLRLVECPRCTLIQLDYVVPEEELLPRDYPYVSGNSGALKKHFAGLAQWLRPTLRDGDLVVDIGANDGSFLAELSLAYPGVVPLAVEPTDQVRTCIARGLLATQAFFTSDLARVIRSDHGAARVITAINVFGHCQDPHDFLDGVNLLLADDGRLIIENQDWMNIVNGLQIDTIYHEHLRYYTPASLGHLLTGHDLMITSWERLNMHGGSFRAVAVRQQYDLQGRAEGLAVHLAGLLAYAADQGLVYAVGAPTRATPLVNYSGIGRYLACACELAGSEKIGAYIPGTNVPVVDEKRLFEDQPPYALLLAWDLEDILVPVLRRRGYRGKIIIPLPEPRFSDG